MVCVYICASVCVFVWRHVTKHNANWLFLGDGIMGDFFLWCLVQRFSTMSMYFVGHKYIIKVNFDMLCKIKGLKEKKSLEIKVLYSSSFLSCF